ncbi:MAG: hypothetical protein KJ077_33680 [Anaerolineae bacterium]|nr:hypothetical protein [Anaerolineae bacterium]
MQPVIYNTANNAIIQEMQKGGIYDTFMQQIARVPTGPQQIFIFIDAAPDRLIFYLYHRGFLLETDNGFSAITIQDPAGCPELVKVVEAELKETLTSAITTLWVDNPQRRN